MENKPIKLSKSNEYSVLKEDIYFGKEFDIVKETIQIPNEFQSGNEFADEPVEYFENHTIQKNEKNKRDYKKLIRKMGYLVASTVAVVTIAQATTRTPNIPDDAIEFNGHYYKLYGERYTWIEAQELCEESGGYLVVITSEEEQRFIESINHVPRWIGSNVPFETNERGNFKTRGDGENGYICEWD